MVGVVPTAAPHLEPRVLAAGVAHSDLDEGAVLLGDDGGQGEHGRLVVVGMHELDQRHALELGVAVADPLLGGPVGPDQLAAGADGDDEIGDRLHDRGRDRVKAHLAHRMNPMSPNSMSGQSAAEPAGRSEEHTSELQSLMSISYAVLCSNKKTYLS